MRSTKNIIININDSSTVAKKYINLAIQTLGGISLLTAFLLSFTNRIIIYPILLSLGILMLSLASVVSVKKLLINKLWLALMALGLWFIITAILSKLPVKYMLTYSFFRHDGNFFISFLPLFFLPLLKYTKAKTKGTWSILIQLIIWTIAGITYALTFSFLLHHPIGKVDMYGIYFYLFKSHNGAGSFYLVMFFITLLMLLNPHFKNSRVGNALAVLSFTIALWFTRSRGSIFGILVASAILIIEHTKPLKFHKQTFIAISLGAIIIVNLGILLYGYRGWLDLNKPDQNYFQVRELPASFNTLSTQKYERFANIADRLFYLWPRALDDFLKSPIIGIGFTRFNDVPMYLEGIPGYVMLNTTQINIQFNDSHAHHTFLHVMAETGIVGLTLLIIFIHYLLKFTKSLQHWLAPGLYYAIWGMLGASFTEHRFFTPSGMLVITMLLVIAYISQENKATFNTKQLHSEH